MQQKPSKLPGRLDVEPAQLEREGDDEEAIERDGRQREDAQLAGERRQEAGQLTAAARAPRDVIQAVDAAVVDVDAGDRQQVDAHEHVGEGEQTDEQRVRLQTVHVCQKQCTQVACTVSYTLYERHSVIITAVCWV